MSLISIALDASARKESEGRKGKGGVCGGGSEWRKKREQEREGESLGLGAMSSQVFLVPIVELCAGAAPVASFEAPLLPVAIPSVAALLFMIWWVCVVWCPRHKRGVEEKVRGKFLTRPKLSAKCPKCVALVQDLSLCPCPAYRIRAPTRTKMTQRF